MSDPEPLPASSREPAPSDSQAETPYQGFPGAAPPNGKAVAEHIGQYRLERPLGQGGMGEVFLAWDELLERRVAIKRIRSGSHLTPDHRERFRREARAAARLSHSAIVQVHDFISDACGDAIVMEYVDGSTLAQRLATGPLGAREAVRLAREITEGLAAAHAAGLIHRDLKVENVVITPQGQAKILDFGLVKPLIEDPRESSLTRQGMLLGTYHSMSPEQASGKQVDERSDLFSLGVVLYEMLAGHSPFRGENPLDTLRRVITHSQPALSTLRDDVPTQLSDLVDRLLAKSRDDRPHRAREVIQALRDIEDRMASTSSGSVSEMPTADWTRAVRKSARGKRSLTSTGGMSVRRRLRHAVAAGVLAVVALTTIVAVTPGLEVSAEDRQAYLQIEGQIEAGKVDLLPYLDKLEAISRRSPGFLEARLLAVRLALKLCQSKRQPSYLDRASRLVSEARKLTPGDPRLLVPEFQIAFASNRMGDAEALLAEMERRLPGNAEVLVQRALWREKRNDWQKALQDLKSAVDQEPSWRNRVWLAQMEARHGLVPEARATLGEVPPGNVWAKEILAEIELGYGDLPQAERLFRELTRTTDRRNDFTNLGMAYFLQGRYTDAEDAYRSALELDSDHPIVLLDLADAEQELHHDADAAELYRRALERVDREARTTELTAADEMIRAQCLARLGRSQEAVKVTEGALSRSPDDPQIQLQAALVYSLVGEPKSAVIHAKKAISGGLQKRWLRGSAFSPLASDPEFKSLVR